MGLRDWISRYVPDDCITRRYKNAGGDVGDLVSYSFMGEPVGLERAVRRWTRAEAAYARRGYRTISLEDFIAYGGYGADIDSLLRVPRPRGEDPTFHALAYQQQGTPLAELTIRVESPDGGIIGTYTLPTSDLTIRT